MKNIAYIGSWKHFQKINGLYGLKHDTVEINGNVTLGHIHTDTHTHTCEYRARILCEVLTEFAITAAALCRVPPPGLLQRAMSAAA